MDEQPAEAPLCACGCGHPVQRYRNTNSKRGHYRGQYAKYRPRHSGGYDRGALTDDELLDEWNDVLRENVAWQDAHERLGVSRTRWSAVYHRAERAGDPRARKIWRDISEREHALRERAELGLTNRGHRQDAS